MKDRSSLAWSAKSRAAMLLLVVAIVALPTAVLAQDEQDGPRQGGMAFAGGQMVRGTVTATSADHLTVKTEAGEAPYSTYLVNAAATTSDRLVLEIKLKHVK